jgi:hypothetical protein
MIKSRTLQSHQITLELIHLSLQVCVQTHRHQRLRKMYVQEKARVENLIDSYV